MQGNIVTTTEQKKSPAELIELAVQGGADLEKLKGLLELQERWEASQAKKAYHEAMAKFKAENIEIIKDKDVAFGNTKYSHATLANVVRTITAALSKYGLSASWRPSQDTKICVTCKITHVLGHSEETTLCADPDSSGNKNSIQAVGSTVTYLERYTILAATGLATCMQDDDGRPAVASAFINEWQISDLRDSLKTKDLSEANLLKYMSVAKIEEIPADQYSKAENAIKSAKKKDGAK